MAEFLAMRVYEKKLTFEEIPKRFREEVKKILKENSSLLKLIAETLLEEETITKEQIDSLVETGHLPQAESVEKKEAKEEKEIEKKSE